MPVDAPPLTSPKRVRWLPLAVLAVVAAALVTGTMLPSEWVRWLRRDLGALSQVLSWLDHAIPGLNLVHVLLFALLTLFLRWAFPRLRAWQVGLLALALATLTEVLQMLIPGRHPRVSDVLHDLLGVAMGLLLLKLLKWMRHPRVLAASLSLSGLLLLAAVLALPWVRLPAGEVFGHALQWADVLLATAIALRGLASVSGAPLRWQAFHGWLLAYLALMLVSALASEDVPSSLGKWIGVVYLGALAVLVQDLARATEFSTRLARTWLVATALVVLAGLAAVVAFWVGPELRELASPWLSRYGSLPPGNYPRIVAGFDNPNMLCGYLMIGFAVALASWRMAWTSTGAACSLASAIVVAAVFTWSPALGALALMMGTAAWWTLRLRHPLLATSVLAAALLVALAGLGAVAINAGDPFGAPSVRLQVWQAAIDTVAAHPVFGVGVGRAVMEVHFAAPDGIPQRLTDAHNVWLNIAGQAGVATALVLLGLVLTTLRCAGRPWRDDVPQGPLRAALMAAVAACWLYQGLTSSVEDTRHAWLLLGWLAAFAPPAAISRTCSPA